MKRISLLAVALLAAGSGVLASQGKGKKYSVSTSRAVVVTREVLGRQGFEVIRIEERGPDQVVWYRAGNQGRGKGKGPPLKMIIRREADRVVFVETPPAILVDIDVRLRLP